MGGVFSSQECPECEYEDCPEIPPNPQNPQECPECPEENEVHEHNSQELKNLYFVVVVCFHVAFCQIVNELENCTPFEKNLREKLHGSRCSKKILQK